MMRRTIVGWLLDIAYLLDRSDGTAKTPYGPHWTIHEAQGPHPLMLEQAFGLVYVYRGPVQHQQPYMDRAEAAECAVALAQYAATGGLPAQNGEDPSEERACYHCRHYRSLESDLGWCRLRKLAFHFEEGDEPTLNEAATCPHYAEKS